MALSDDDRRLLPCGPRAWLLELDEGDVLGVAAAVRAGAHPAVVEVVPGAQTVLVTLGDTDALEPLGAWLRTVTPSDIVDRTGTATIELAVTYDGEDLDDVAAAADLSTDEVVERHTAPIYTCAFCGFAPGFSYLTGLDPLLHLPRRPTPRTRIPAGAVAIAAGYSAVYPSPSPGGWQLIGRTDAPMWRADRDPPALIVPGGTVRFVDVRRC